MADPFSWSAATWAAIGTGASAAMSVVGALQQGKASSNAASYNADVARENARLAKEQGLAAQSEQNRAARKKIGSMIAAYGASGVSGSSGSPLDELNDSVRQSTLDNMTVGYNTQLKALGYQNQATLYDEQADNYSTSSYLNGAGNAFSGIASGLSSYTYFKGIGNPLPTAQETAS